MSISSIPSQTNFPGRAMAERLDQQADAIAESAISDDQSFGDIIGQTAGVSNMGLNAIILSNYQRAIAEVNKTLASGGT